jgi:hypothetical protein
MPGGGPPISSASGRLPAGRLGLGLAGGVQRRAAIIASTAARMAAGVCDRPWDSRSSGPGLAGLTARTRQASGSRQATPAIGRAARGLEGAAIEARRGLNDRPMRTGPAAWPEAWVFSAWASGPAASGAGSSAPLRVTGGGAARRPITRPITRQATRPIQAGRPRPAAPAGLGGLGSRGLALSLAFGLGLGAGEGDHLGRLGGGRRLGGDRRAQGLGRRLAHDPGMGARQQAAQRALGLDPQGQLRIGRHGRLDPGHVFGGSSPSTKAKTSSSGTVMAGSLVAGRT